MGLSRAVHISTSGAYCKYFNYRKVTPTNYMVQLSATMEQARETQLAQLSDVLDFRRVIARYDVLSTLHETGLSDHQFTSSCPSLVLLIMCDHYHAAYTLIIGQ